MPFRIAQRHVDDYHRDGFTIFRRVVPASLVGDLRRVAEAARALARSRHGAQAQRLQPLAGCDLDQGPLQAYLELPELIEAVHAVLTPRHDHSGGLAMNAFLFEPADSPWCTGWHRDWRDNSPVVRARWVERFSDAAYFNQANCALYDDGCAWVVAGSHLRTDDTPGEAAARAMPDLAGLDTVAVERALASYCEAMPGAVRLDLAPGDYALYRNTLWHLGNYVPYRRRATIHDAVDTPEFRAWRADPAAAEPVAASS